MDLDLRKLRYFAAVAEHRHFGRAAQQLYIAQPVLSRQIRSLEQELGCELLIRTTRSVQLTAAGEQLRDEARGVFATVDSAVRRVLEVDRGVERLVVGFAPGLHVSAAVRAFATRRPDVEVSFLTLNWWEQDAPLRDGRIDVGFVRRPLDETDLRAIDIGTDPRVACMAFTHRLARRRRLTMGDLDGEQLLDVPARRTASVDEKFELIAAGTDVALVPRSVAEAYPRPDVTRIPVTDAVPFETCLVVAKGRREARIRQFLAVAVETLRDTRSPRRSRVTSTR